MFNSFDCAVKGGLASGIAVLILSNFADKAVSARMFVLSFLFGCASGGGLAGGGGIAISVIDCCSV